jgi:hypothetical protein
LQLADVCQFWMGEHRQHVAAQGLDAGGRHLVSQELDGGLGEHALLCIDDQACITQAIENFSQMLQMLLLVSAGYDDVVQVAINEREPRQDPVNHALEGVARITQPERHAAKLEQPERCADGCLSDVSRMHIII